MLQNSVKRFSTGVPLSAIFVSAVMERTALLWMAVGFLMFCASSITITLHLTFAKIFWSERSTP